MEPILIHDFLSFRFLSGLHLDPTGKRAIFVESVANYENNDYAKKVMLFDNGKCRTLLSEGSPDNMIWDDDQTVLFTATKEKKEEADAPTIFYRVRINEGGDPEKAFEIPLKVASIKKLSSGLYLVAAALDLRKEGSKTEEDKKRIAEEADYEVLEDLPFWFNGRGFMYSKRTQLFLFKEKGNVLTPITKPDFDLDSYDADETVVVYSGHPHAHKPTLKEKLYCYDIAKAKATELLKDDYGIQCVRLWKNKILLALSDFADYGLNQNPAFYVIDRKSGKLSPLCSPDESIESSLCTDIHYGGGNTMVIDGDYAYYVTTNRNAAHLRRLDLFGRATTIVEEEGDIVDFDVCNGRILLFGDYSMKLTELYEWKGKELVQLTNENTALKGKYVAKPRKIKVNSSGWDIDGWVLLPKDYDPKKKYPAILDIHGGPKCVYGEIYCHEMQVWASNGYFVLFANPFGGDGRGNRFADLRGKYGSIDYVNLMDFVDEALKKYPSIDSKKLCVTGGSYGGFMTNWIVTHTHRFVAAATQRSISNWMSMAGISDIGCLFTEDQNAVEFLSEDGPEILWEHSPLKYAAGVKTPLLIIHSDEDYRCPISEGYQIYSAFVHQGVEARMVVFHGENHELSRSGKPKHRVRRLEEITSWFDSHIKKGKKK